MSNNPNQIKIIGATQVKYAVNPISSKESYQCANALITRGVTSAPTDLPTCYQKFPQIKEIAENMGVTLCHIWNGPGNGPTTAPVIFDGLLGITSEECGKIAGLSYGLGADWLGCLWGSPMASFSCTCPTIGKKFADYLKLRLNVATFWNTPISAPPQRSEFVDVLQNGERVTIVVPGNLKVKAGDLVELKTDNMSAYPSASGIKSILSKKYYVLSVKHTYTSSGTHETNLVLSNLRVNEIKTRIPIQTPEKYDFKPPNCPTQPQ
jgi:hypothetical protein